MGIRFAPSPTGRFHVGNLRTAWISWLWARKLGKPWVVRFEDIDAPRVVAGAREDQLEDMAALGLVPDELVTQSERRARHLLVFELALEPALSGATTAVYPCFCSRKDLRAQLESAASAPHEAPPEYRGHCRGLSLEETVREGRKTSLPSIAWRFRAIAPGGRGDVIVARTSSKLREDGRPVDPASFVPAYHWACAIDDLDGGYELLVRAGDLAPAAGIQREIQAWLATREEKPFSPAAIFHCSLVVANDGHRLEKRTKGVTLPELEAAGISPAALRAKFEIGFDINSYALAPGKIFGEPAERVALAQLSL